MNATLIEQPVGKSRQPHRASISLTNKAWVASAPEQPMNLEVVDLGSLGAEDVEIAVEHCGLCHSDLSILNNDWSISQYPAILGHEVIGQITAVGPNARGVTIGQRVGVGWHSGSCIVNSACRVTITFAPKCNSPSSGIVVVSRATSVRIGRGLYRCRRS